MGVRNRSIQRWTPQGMRSSSPVSVATSGSVLIGNGSQLPIITAGMDSQLGAIATPALAGGAQADVVMVVPMIGLRPFTSGPNDIVQFHVDVHPSPPGGLTIAGWKTVPLSVQALGGNVNIGGFGGGFAGSAPYITQGPGLASGTNYQSFSVQITFHVINVSGGALGAGTLTAAVNARVLIQPG